MTNVTSVLLAIEADFLHAHIGLFLRGAHGAAQGGHTQHPPALGDQALAVPRRSGMKDHGVAGLWWQAGDGECGHGLAGGCVGC